MVAGLSSACLDLLPAIACQLRVTNDLVGWSLSGFKPEAPWAFGQELMPNGPYTHAAAHEPPCADFTTSDAITTEAFNPAQRRLERHEVKPDSSLRCLDLAGCCRRDVMRWVFHGARLDQGSIETTR